MLGSTTAWTRSCITCGIRSALPDIPVRAHRFGQLVGYAVLERSVAAAPRVPERLRALAVLKSAVMQGCEMCQDIGSFEARANRG